eukprot:TRINITY_DN24585_c0_g1_i3.p1 TRINITY_DN24585_c0_g1~~TRINITY_DN24585_c0_g1_i3.p1  ORF type:complete len:317 (-),score=90.62 TRINITY_DN24585_c0_g1_i3:1-951(-)
MRRVTVLEQENHKIKEELVKTAAELERAVNERSKAEITLEQMRLEYEKKRVQIEKEYVSMAKNKDTKISLGRREAEEESKAKRLDKDLWESEKIELNRRFKEMNRKFDAALIENRDLKEQNDELINDKNTLNFQLEELRTAYRAKLGKATGENAHGELLRTYQEKENFNNEQVRIIEGRIERLRGKCRSLREYAKQLKFLAEDLLPENQYRPDILDVPNPEIIKEENGEDLENAEKKEQLYLKEIERLKEDNSRAVSYTHLTLPTILLVQISVVAVSLKKKKKYSQNSEQLNQLKLELQEDTITHGRTQLTIDIAT